MASSFMNGKYKGQDIQDYKVCKARTDSTEANTYLGRMLSSGMDCVKCGWVMGRHLKKRKRIKVSHDLPSSQPLNLSAFNLSALAKKTQVQAL